MSEQPPKTPLEKGITALQLFMVGVAGLMVVFNAPWILGLESADLPPVEEGRAWEVFQGITLFLIAEGALEFVKRKWGR